MHACSSFSSSANVNSSASANVSTFQSHTSRALKWSISVQILQIKDDVLVHGVDEEHNRRLRAVLERFREPGLTLRQEKCHPGKTEARWFGMIFSKEGMSPDPEKTAIIRNWPAR